ncbi:MAG: methyltransferase domain-containing protein [Chloroflexi bacterium]|nr:methyltransferase domain-containing protein [Chloroflexota bacterium]
MPPDHARRFCSDEELEQIGYDGHGAAGDLERWRCCGVPPATQELINVLRAEGVGSATLLDVGAGVGIVHLSLLEAGAAKAVDVDASRDYLAAARGEAERRGLADRVDYRYGDVVELAAELPAADIVTLDAVICCYPHHAALLRAAVRPGPRLVGLIYPHDAWWSRVRMHLSNLIWALRRRPDHWYIARRAQIDRVMGEAGYGAAHRGGTRSWKVVVYRRELASNRPRSG